MLLSLKNVKFLKSLKKSKVFKGVSPFFSFFKNGKFCHGYIFGQINSEKTFILNSG